MARPSSKHFVGWEEEYVSNDRGSRVVDYYLKDRHGNTKLAVVGTERSLRHMVYVVSDEFLHLTNNSKSNSSSSMKWRSRREVVDWLDSLLSKPRPASSGDHITNITNWHGIVAWYLIWKDGHPDKQALFGKFLSLVKHWVGYFMVWLYCWALLLMRSWSFNGFQVLRRHGFAYAAEDIV